jgi:hypothetical protein
MRVKGSMVLDYVKIIRDNKDKDWNRYLAPSDWEIINGKVLFSNWYPFEAYRRIAFAVFKIIANGNLDVARAFGRFNIIGLMKVYENLVVPGDPAAGVEKLARIRKTFMEGDLDIQVLDKSKNGLTFSVPIGKAEQEKEHADAFAYTVMGNLDEIVARSGGKNVKIVVEPYPEKYDLKVSWE